MALTQEIQMLLKIDNWKIAREEAKKFKGQNDDKFFAELIKYLFIIDRIGLIPNIKKHYDGRYPKSSPSWNYDPKWEQQWLGSFWANLLVLAKDPTPAYKMEYGRLILQGEETEATRALKELVSTDLRDLLYYDPATGFLVMGSFKLNGLLRVAVEATGLVIEFQCMHVTYFFPRRRYQELVKNRHISDYESDDNWHC